MSAVYGISGVVGFLALVAGAYVAITLRTLRWLKAGAIPAGSERKWGIAVTLAGAALCLTSAIHLPGSPVQRYSDLWQVTALQVGLLMASAVVMAVAVAPRSAR